MYILTANGKTNLFLIGMDALAVQISTQAPPVHDKNKDSIFIREEYHSKPLTKKYLHI
jgi:hypothetical protein